MSQKTQQELEASIERAEAALAKPGAVYPKGAADGVKDMIAFARAVRSGQWRRPFSHSRHYLPDVDMAAFANRFHTMITGWQIPGDMERTYGMADAAEWLEGQDLAAFDADALAAKARDVADRARQVLESVTPGTALGQVNPEAYETLKEASAVLDPAAPTPQSVALLADAIRDTLASTVLVFDVDPSANLFLTGADAASLRERVASDPFLKNQYGQVKDIAGYWSLDDLKALEAGLERDDVDYTAMNQRYRMWSSSETTFNFVTPDDAVGARVELSLDAAANQGGSMAEPEMWVDSLRVFSGTEGDWAVPNPGFEEVNPSSVAPAGWRDESQHGASATLDRTHAFEGESSLHLSCGAQADARAVAVTAEPVPVTPGLGSTATFRLKIDGTLPEGLRFVIRFLDKDGNECGAFERTINRSSYLSQGPGMALSCQADAIVAFVENSREAAEKAKREILLELDEFCQGAEHWMVENCRPYGADAYGAVQAGRIMCSVAAAYTLICHMGVFDEAETRRLLDLLGYTLLYVTDTRDRTALSGDEVQLGATNWQTDMMAGAAIVCLTLLQAGVLDAAGQATARRIVQDSAWFLKSQLNDHVNPDGSFPESLRYHLAAMSRYTFVARALGHCTGADWYRETRLKDMFRYFSDMVTPAYPFSNTKVPSQPGEAEPLSSARYEAGDGVPSTPTFGDHQVGDGSEFAQLGLCAGDVARVDERLGRQMLATWKRAGKPMAPFWTEAIAFEHLLVDASAADGADPAGTGDWGPLTSNLDYPDSGIALFRKGFATPREQMLAVMASPRPIGHGHFDEGSFILYKDRVITVADPGIIGYFDSSKDWLVSSSAHATMQFASRHGAQKAGEVRADRLDVSNFSREHGWVDTPRVARVLGTSFGGPVERIDMEIDNAEDLEEGRTPAVHTRSILWLAEPELVVVVDRVCGFDGRIRFTLPVAARALPELPELPALSSVAGEDGSPLTMRHECNYGITLDATFLTPLASLNAEWGICSPVAPQVDGHDQLSFLRAEADAANGFVIVLNPRRPGEGEATAALAADGTLTLTKDGWTGTVDLSQVPGAKTK